MWQPPRGAQRTQCVKVCGVTDVRNKGEGGGKDPKMTEVQGAGMAAAPFRLQVRTVLWLQSDRAIMAKGLQSLWKQHKWNLYWLFKGKGAQVLWWAAVEIGMGQVGKEEAEGRACILSYL